MAPTQEQISAILVQLSENKALSKEDTKTAKEVIESLGAALAALDEANQDLQFNLSLFKGAADADAAARNGVLAGLQMLAPPAATVDIDAAMKAIDQLRKDIKQGKDIAAVVAAAAKFAVKVAGRFI